MRPFPRTVFLLLALHGTTMTASPSAAQPSPENAAQAETLFRDGRTLIKAGRTSEACAKFTESHRLDPQTGTLLNLALCHEAEGKMASAWAEFNEVIERSGPTSERTTFSQRHAAAVESKLSKLMVRVPDGIASLRLTLDGRSLRSAELGSSIPLDPGDHVVEANAPGKVPWRERVELAPGPATRELVVKLVDAPAASPDALPSTVGASAQGSVAAEPSTGSGRRNIGIVLGAIGLVGFGVGTVYGIRAVDKWHEFRNLCPDAGACPAEKLESARAAKRDLETSANVSTVGVAVGVLGVATGLYFMLTGPSRPNANAVRFVPSIAPNESGLRVEGAF